MTHRPSQNRAISSPETEMVVEISDEEEEDRENNNPFITRHDDTGRRRNLPHSENNTSSSSSSDESSNSSSNETFRTKSHHSIPSKRKDDASTLSHHHLLMNVSRQDLEQYIQSCYVKQFSNTELLFLCFKQMFHCNRYGVLCLSGECVTPIGQKHFDNPAHFSFELTRCEMPLHKPSSRSPPYRVCMIPIWSRNTNHISLMVWYEHDRRFYHYDSLRLANKEIAEQVCTSIRSVGGCGATPVTDMHGTTFPRAQERSQVRVRAPQFPLFEYLDPNDDDDNRRPISEYLFHVPHVPEQLEEWECGFYALSIGKLIIDRASRNVFEPLVDVYSESLGRGLNPNGGDGHDGDGDPLPDSTLHHQTSPFGHLGVHYPNGRNHTDSESSSSDDDPHTITTTTTGTHQRSSFDDSESESSSQEYHVRGATPSFTLSPSRKSLPFHHHSERDSVSSLDDEDSLVSEDASSSSLSSHSSLDGYNNPIHAPNKRNAAPKYKHSYGKFKRNYHDEPSSHAPPAKRHRQSGAMDHMATTAADTTTTTINHQEYYQHLVMEYRSWVMSLRHYVGDTLCRITTLRDQIFGGTIAPKTMVIPGIPCEDIKHLAEGETLSRSLFKYLVKRTLIPDDSLLWSPSPSVQQRDAPHNPKIFFDVLSAIPSRNLHQPPEYDDVRRTMEKFYAFRKFCLDHHFEWMAFFAFYEGGGGGERVDGDRRRLPPPPKEYCSLSVLQSSVDQVNPKFAIYAFNQQGIPPDTNIRWQELVVNQLHHDVSQRLANQEKISQRPLKVEYDGAFHPSQGYSPWMDHLDSQILCYWVIGWCVRSRQIVSPKRLYWDLYQPVAPPDPILLSNSGGGGNRRRRPSFNALMMRSMKIQLFTRLLLDIVHSKVADFSFRIHKSTRDPSSHDIREIVVSAVPPLPFFPFASSSSHRGDSGKVHPPEPMMLSMNMHQICASIRTLECDYHLSTRMPPLRKVFSDDYPLQALVGAGGGNNHSDGTNSSTFQKRPERYPPMTILSRSIKERFSGAPQLVYPRLKIRLMSLADRSMHPHVAVAPHLHDVNLPQLARANAFPMERDRTTVSFPVRGGGGHHRDLQGPLPSSSLRKLTDSSSSSLSSPFDVHYEIAI